MKSRKEYIESLPQLDRIELKLEEDRINENYPRALGLTVRSIFYYVFYLMIIIICNIYLTISERPIINGTPWMIIIIPIAYLGDIMSAAFNSKKKKELYSKYFETQVKRKKREVIK